MYNKTEKLAKVKKSCGTASVVAKIVMIFLILAFVACLVGVISSAAFADKINNALAVHKGNLSFDNMEFGNGILQFDVDVQNLVASGDYSKAILIYCAIASFITAMTAAIFGTLSRILRKLRDSETPFSADVLVSMKRIFIALFALVLLFTGIGAAILIGILLWCIYCIMDYGCALQAEVDDTV